MERRCAERSSRRAANLPHDCGSRNLKDAVPYMIDFTSEQYTRFWDVRWWLVTHITGGTVALLIGPFQFWSGLRRRHLRVHKMSGPQPVWALQRSIRPASPAIIASIAVGPPGTSGGMRNPARICDRRSSSCSAHQARVSRIVSARGR